MTDDLELGVRKHHLTHGLSGYWQAGSITLDSAGFTGAGLRGKNQVTVRPLVDHFSGLVPYQWEAKRTWFDWRTQDANFVVFDHRPGYFTYWAPARQVRDVFGRPARTYRTGPYSILVWHQNLLPALHRWEQSAHHPDPAG